METIRFWASTHSICFDELAAELGQESLLHFTIFPDFVSEGSSSYAGLKISEANKGKLFQLVELCRDKVIVRADLCASAREENAFYSIEAPFEIKISSKRDEMELEKIESQSDHPEVRILGSLSFGSNHFVDCLPSYRCRVHSFESMILDDRRPEFGSWQPVSSYGEIGMDPDVTRTCVLVADIEILSLEKVLP